MKVNGHLRNHAEYLVTFPWTSSERPSFTDFPPSMCSFSMVNRLKTCLVPRGRLPVMLSHLISSLSLFMARSFALLEEGWERKGGVEEGRGYESGEGQTRQSPTRPKSARSGKRPTEHGAGSKLPKVRGQPTAKEGRPKQLAVPKKDRT